MKKTILTFGLISGAIMSVMLAATVPFHDQIGYDVAEVIGYTTLLVAGLLIFVGIRSYRDNVGGGLVTFGRAFSVGVGIALVASVLYVATWQVVYTTLAPDFSEKFSAHLMEEARASGESQAEIDKKLADIRKYAEWYKNPALRAALTFLEPLPVALVIALISAAILRRTTGREPERVERAPDRV
jgi:hypothetical protein